MNTPRNATPTGRAIAAIAGLAAVGSTFGGAMVALAPAASATPAPGQEVNNDWGQTAAQVSEEVNLVVDADTRVVAIRTRYLRALSAYASIKQVQRVATAAHTAALRSTTLADDLSTARTVTSANTRVVAAAREVVVSQLAMTRLVASVTAQVRAQHYVQAPYVAPPIAPTGITAVGASNQVTLSWTPVSGATGYLVMRDNTELATTILPSFTDTGIDNGVAYHYIVIATNVAGWSPVSATIVGRPTAAAPSAPRSVVASPGDGSVELAWAAAPSATGYNIYRQGVVAPIGVTTSTTFTVTGLVNATAYTFTVKAANGAALSSASSSVVSTPVASAPPAPTGLLATPGNGQVSLSWTAPTGATRYQIYRNGSLVASQAGTTYTDTGRTNGTAYTYYVVAYKQNSVASSPSATVSATPVAPPLSAPVGLAATPSDRSVSLSWSAVASATSYEVYRAGVLLGTTATRAYVDSGLTNGITYAYTVKAVNASSTSPASATTSATPVAPVTGAPTGLTGQAADTIANLNWTAVPGATYNVYRGGVLLVTGLSGTTYSNTGLANGVSYTYFVTAVVATVESGQSATVTVTPFAITPAAPTGLAATAGNAQVSLSWTSSANATQYKVYRGASLIVTQSGTTYTDTGLANGTAYSYTVVAVNGSASSIASSAVTSTPLAPAPSAPTGLVAAPGNTQVILNWNAVATATSYRVYRNGVLIASPATATYTNTGLTNGTAYTYYVTAVAATTESTSSSSVTSTPAKPLVSGTFTGPATWISGNHGQITVTIVVVNSVITSANATFTRSDGTETTSINTNSIPQYNTKTVAANSANITKVSGATLTLAAYKTSLQAALTGAGL